MAPLTEFLDLVSATVTYTLLRTTQPGERCGTRIVRGADTARLDLEPQSAGLLAISLGLSAIETDDLRQLEAGMPIYDALYGWCRHATDERHNWPARTVAE